jgi:lipoprotein NlpI
MRGTLRFGLARYAEASADFKRAVDLAPSWHYAALLRHISLARAGAQSVDELAHNASELDLSKWPGPIVKLYMGRLSPDEVRQAAGQGNSSEQNYKACEADFYLGEWHLFANDVASAKPLLQRAAATCPQQFIEFDLAGAELKRLP